jgi:homocysteine S-methyltransferase
MMTDGGLETTLVFDDGFDFPYFAAFPLLDTDDGRIAIERYYRSFLVVAAARDVPFVFDAATWRASADWGDRLGYGSTALADANYRSVDFVREIAGDQSDIIVNGVVGPRGDGYVIADRMSADEAAEYHSAQLETFAAAGVDRASVLTLTYVEEAIGFVRGATGAGIDDVVVSFTVETDGRLPDGTELGDAIATVDAATDASANFFMINCAHPSHIAHDVTPELAARIGGLRVNGSPLSHAELDEAVLLHADPPEVLAEAHAGLRDVFPEIQMLGGCCGTGLRHVEAILDRW